MRRERALRIGSLRALLHRDAAKGGRVLAEIGDDAARDVRGDGTGALGALGGVYHLAIHGLARHADQIAQKLHLDLVIGHIRLGNDR